MEPFWFFTGIIAVLPQLERKSEMQPQESPRRNRKLAAATPSSS
jgi:hypothetical protein